MPQEMLFTSPGGSSPEPVLAIHGWGFNKAVWDETGRQLERLGHGFSAVDLPGFGECPMPEGDYTLPALADSVMEAMPAVPCVLVGWSLGGLVALEVARRSPSRVRALILVASAPRFTNADGWSHGVEPEVLAGFAATLAEDHRAALTRFLVLQAGRTDSGRATVNELKPLLFRHGTPDRKALEGGLALLRETDYRDVLAGVPCPVLFVLGDRDNLLSFSGAADLLSLCRDGWMAVIRGSAHAPFISHPEAFLQALRGFFSFISPSDP